MLAETGWAVALPLAYFVLLPFGHRFARYLVPALPALAVVALVELRRRWTTKAWVAAAIVIAPAGGLAAGRLCQVPGARALPSPSAMSARASG